MKFSILIAHYNNFEYFKDCYQSIISQTYQDFEVIILDDCSTDDSYEKVKDWVKNDPRFRVFQNEENRGVGYTKHRLIELATGEICGFLDPDDALVKKAVETSINAYKNEKIIATYSQLYLCSPHLEIQGKFPNTRKIRNGNPIFLNINFEIAHFFTFRKTAYLKIEGIDLELTSAVDQDLYLKLYEQGDFKLIKKPLYMYRLHNKGVSQEKSKKEQLNKNWDTTLRNTLKRRHITKIYGKNIAEIENLPNFVSQKENTFLKRLLRKLKLL